MDIKSAIDYAQLAVKKSSEENKNKDVPSTPEELAKQVGELMYLMSITYNKEQAHQKALEFLNGSEAKND